jgi:hypothetical protein
MSFETLGIELEVWVSADQAGALEVCRSDWGFGSLGIQHGVWSFLVGTL